MTKKIICIALALVLCFGLFACSGETAEETKAPTTAATNPAETTAPTQPEETTAPATEPTTPTVPAEPTRTPEEVACSFVSAILKQDAEALASCMADFEQDILLAMAEIDVPEGSDKNALLIAVLETLLTIQGTEPAEVDVEGALHDPPHVARELEEMKKQYVTDELATEETIATIQEMACILCYNTSDSPVEVDETVICIKVGGEWYVSYVLTMMETDVEIS